MDRSLAGRLGIGRLDRSRPAPARRPTSRARAPRRELAAAGDRRWRRRLAACARPARDCLRFIWRRRRLRVLVLVGAALSPLAVGGWVWFRHSSLVRVEHVRISGVHGRDASAIDAALLGAARRMSTLDVRVSALRAAVAPFAVVREVRASASFPHGLRIGVLERMPVASLEAGGTRTAVAADGVVLGPALLSGSLPTVGAASAPAIGARVKAAPLLGALAALGAAPAPLARLVARAFNGPRGLEIALRGGPSAYFGDATRPHAKWLALALVLGSERSAGAAYIDVRVPERPVAGFAPGTRPPLTSAAGAATGGEQGSLAESTTAALAAGVKRGAGEAPEGAGETREGASSQSGQTAPSESASGGETPSAGTPAPGH